MNDELMDDQLKEKHESAHPRNGMGTKSLRECQLLKVNGRKVSLSPEQPVLLI